MKTLCRSYLELCKIKVALLAACSAAAGYLLAAPEVHAGMPMVVSGVFFLACGALGLNQYQERELDAAMPRTCGRPIPSGRIEPVHAFAFSLSLVGLGFSLLLPMTGGTLTAALGGLALLWYNGIYTFLKRKSAFAAVPGAFIGAIPPAMGWIAGGGEPGDPRLLPVCFFFFIWQVPHSWLLMTHYGREYEKAGLPSVTAIFSAVQLQRVTCSWMFAAAVSSLFLSAMGTLHYFPIRIALFAVSLWLIGNGIKSLFRNSDAYASLPVFNQMNYCLLAVLFLLSADRLWFLL